MKLNLSKCLAGLIMLILMACFLWIVFYFFITANMQGGAYY